MTTPTSATVSAMMSAMDATKSAALTASTTASTTSNALRFVHLSQMSQQELINRKQIIQNRLKELDVNIGLRPVTKQEQSQRQQILLETEETHQQIGEKDKNANNSSISGGTTSTKSLDHTANLASILVATSPQPALQKSDTHWDYTLKEMMWLSADFQSERKRQMSQAKKLANAVKLHHSTLQSRKLRERAEFEARVRRLAGKLGRDVYKGFWKKLERVVGYKQRLDGENRRRRDMDRHLVKLVRQTEKYGEILIGGGQHEFGLDSDGPRLTIEEALSQANSIPRRRSTTGGIDYTKMDRDESYNESSFYGEKISASAPVKKGDDVSTTQICSAADDEDYEPGIDEIMEEEENEAMDMKEFLYAASEQSGDDVKEEIQKLNEEMSMDLENVLQRLLEEGDGHTANVKTSSPPLIEVIGEKSYDDDDGRDEGFAAKSDLQNAAVSAGKSRGESTQQNRRVKFAATSEERIIYPIERVDESMPTPQDVLPIESGNPGSWSLLDEDDSEEKDEFHPSGEDDVDDETTIEAEEKLEREMSYADEIALLHRESEMSIHELKAMYAGMEEAAGNSCQNQIGNVGDATADDPDSAESTILVFEEDDSGEKDEYQPENDLELDDETTIEADEKLGREMSYEDEIALLKRDSEISIEELREMYANIGDGHGAAECDERSDSLDCREKDEISADELFEDDDYEEQDEFQPTGDDAQDDETTIEAEEKLAREMSYEDEIALLQKESEMTIEELKAMYISMKESQPECDGEPNESMDVESDTEIPSLAVLSKENIDEDVDDDDEFALTDTNEAVDDETTIAAEEKLGREMTYEEEISILEKENDMTLEELRNLYGLDRSETLVSPKRQRYKISDETDTAECDGSNSQKKLKTESDDGIEALQSLVESDAKARRTMLTRPFLLARWVKLRNYQQIGLNWLVSIQSRRLNGILADEMGLGKTLQTISMLAYLASYKGIWGPHLIIVPTSCLVNWEVEFKRFCPALKVLCYYGNAKRRKELRVGWTKSNWHHVVITSYQLAVQDAFAFKRKKWYYLVLDEAHNIKNFESQRWQTLINFNTQRRLLLTGTPLQNNLMELWSLLHFLMPHVFRDRKEFSYWFSNPMDNIIEGNAKRNDDLISRLHGIIRPFILRRLKKDVETQLPGKYEHIVKCQLSRRQMFLYEEFMARSSTRKALDGGNYLGMMNVLMQLRKVCNHPDLFEPRSVTTPLVMEPLSMSVATCVVNAIESKSGLEQLSSFVTLPLWSCGQGHPSSEDSARFDDILVAQLLRLMTPNSDIIKTAMEMDFTEPLPEQKINSGLVSLLNCICADEKQDYISKANFIARLNSWRCQTRAFPFPNRTIRAVSMDPRPLDLPLFDELDTYQIASTPSDLLAMRRNLSDRSKELDDIADKFVFCVPKAQTSRPVLYSSKHASSSLAPERSILSKTTATLNSFNSAFHKVSSRLKTCFPDKKLVQFDAGKLQTLAILLRQLKRDGHRVLIFTQMSKMLDVLEAFLNLNGHTYLRLDGATDVEKRQRLMDRFNSDTKIFCFILSTRSGGLGINLTGADTVVFYDSDWNPAMDAQAQDRAHRIGQTREVHIYRMVTEHSIEENILTKAKQKRNLDFLVMDEGKFHAASVMNNGEHGEEEDSGDEEGFTTGKLRNIFGITNYGGESNHEEETTLSKDQIESTMNMLEDEDDVKAMQSARKEAADELQEFDESIQFKQDGDETDTTDDSIGKQDKVAKKSKQKKKKVVTDQKVIDARQIGGDEKDSTKNDDDEKELEKEFANWQSKVGMDATKINDSLNPLELYGLKIKESVDPYFSPYYFAEQKRLEDATNTTIELDLDEIERIKIEEEQRAFEDGDLLSTFPDPEALPRQRQLYSREKARLRAETIKRKLTGQNWITKIDELSKKPFYFNIDTGEAIWEKPNVLQMLEANEAARSGGWQILPLKLLVSIMECLVPFPDRNNCGATCRRWHEAATDISFVKHVWPVEMGALAMNDKKLGKNHFRTIADAISAAVPGDTIELGDGHYWVQDPGLVVDIPLRIIGDEVDPSHVVVELSGDILWKTCGWMEGVTIRRPRIATGIASKSDILRIESGGRLDLFHCVFDNHGSFGNTVSMVGNNSGGRWKKASILGGDKSKSGLLLDDNAFAEFTDCEISDNAGVGVTCRGAAVISLEDCRFERNGVDTVVDDDTVSISDYNIANGH